MRRLMVSMLIWMVERNIAMLLEQLPTMHRDLQDLKVRRQELYLRRMELEAGRD